MGRDSDVRKPASAAPAEGMPRAKRLPWLPIALTLFFCAFALLPRISGHSGLVWTYLGVGGALFVWYLILLAGARTHAKRFLVELVPPLKTHYIQATVQSSIYVYWGLYWPNVFDSVPLIASQLVFFYAFDSLLSWSRGRAWRLGFGPVPIILSTNLFMWFKDDWFVFQFAMVATCALGKEFIRWNRDGKNTHIFNPSAFGLALCSVVLITTGTTRLTWGVEVASTLALPPYIYVLIFCVGLVVQYFFAVTLMTVSAVAVLYVLNLIYTGSTGLYQFVDTNIPIAVFLGLHLLVTDPSTSPRSNTGRIVFGGLYGAANFVLYSVLGWFGVPDFYDKLLPVPILNLLVPLIDRWAKSGLLGKFNGWEARFRPKAVNLVHMGCWIALFVLMVTTGFVQGAHPGASVAFWKKAYDEGKPGAGERLVKVVGSLAESGNPAACNELGEIYVEGKMTEKNELAAAHYFARSCELGNPQGCGNVAWLFLFKGLAESETIAMQALERLESECGKRPNGRNCFLIGYAFETGRGRPADKARALEFYREGCERGNVDACKNLARLRILEHAGGLEAAVPVLEKACVGGDAQSCLLLANMLHDGAGIARDEARAMELLDRACQLGSQQACEALAGPVRWMSESPK